MKSVKLLILITLFKLAHLTCVERFCESVNSNSRTSIRSPNARYNLFLGVNVREDPWYEPDGDIIAFYVCRNGLEPNMMSQTGSNVPRQCSAQHEVLIRDDGDNENQLVKYSLSGGFLTYEIDHEKVYSYVGSTLCLCNDGSVRNNMGKLIDPICDPTIIIGDVILKEETSFFPDHDESHGSVCETIKTTTTDRLSSEFISNVKDEEKISADITAKLTAALSSKYKNMVVDFTVKGDVNAEASFTKNIDKTTTTNIESNSDGTSSRVKVSNSCFEKLSSVKYVQVLQELKMTWPVITKCGTNDEEIDRRVMTTTTFVSSLRRLDSLSDDEKIKLSSPRFRSISNKRLDWVNKLMKKHKFINKSTKFWKMPQSFLMDKIEKIKNLIKSNSLKNNDD